MRGLQVGVAGHDHAEVVFGLFQQGALQAGDEGGDGLELVAQVEADVEGHLVVARACGVQLAADRADLFDQARFDVHVDVFEADLEVELAGFDFSQDLLESARDLLGVLGRDDRLPGKHPRVGHRSLDVVAVEALVEGDAGGKFLDESVGRCSEASCPGLVAHDGTPFGLRIG